MKTNHNRGFQDPGSDIAGGFTVFQGHGETPLSGKRVFACATRAGETERAIRRDRAGAKKFVHSRTRFHEDAALKKIVRDL